MSDRRVVIPFSDLAEFCNRKRPSAVRTWLQDRGILYFLDADGRPCTTEQVLNEALLKGRRTKPNWDAQR